MFQYVTFDVMVQWAHSRTFRSWRGRFYKNHVMNRNVEGVMPTWIEERRGKRAAGGRHCHRRRPGVRTVRSRRTQGGTKTRCTVDYDYASVTNRWFVKGHETPCMCLVVYLAVLAFAPGVFLSSRGLLLSIPRTTRSPLSVRPNGTPFLRTMATRVAPTAHSQSPAST